LSGSERERAVGHGISRALGARKSSVSNASGTWTDGTDVFAPELVGPSVAERPQRGSANSHKTSALARHTGAAVWDISLAPFGAPRIRAVKGRKHYHFDWSIVPEPGARFSTWSHRTEVGTTGHRGRDLDLRYFRDVDLREVDFVVVEVDGPSSWSVQTRRRAGYSRFVLSEGALSSCEAWQISATGTKLRDRRRDRVAPHSNCSSG
jgi:hypothetical protein